jgi:hypothetical protein
MMTVDPPSQDTVVKEGYYPVGLDEGVLAERIDRPILNKLGGV